MRPWKAAEGLWAGLKPLELPGVVISRRHACTGIEAAALEVPACDCEVLL